MTIKEWLKENFSDDEDIQDALYYLNDELTFEDLRPFVVKSKIPKSCASMFNSIITYEKDDNLVIESCRKYQNKPSYSGGESLYKEFGKLSDEELMEEIKFWRARHKVHWNAHTDSEGLSYNSTAEISLDELFGVRSPRLQFECLKEAEKRFDE